MPEVATGVELIPVLPRSGCDALADAARAVTSWEPAPLYRAPGAEPLIVREVRSALLLDERAMTGELAASVRGLKARVEMLAAHGDLRAGDAQIVLYPQGGHFALHQDASANPREWRKRSVVVYLNDGFRSGATVFPSHGVRVEPRAGHALMFPPHLAHFAEPVTEGAKLVVVFWLGRGVSPAG